MNQEILDKIARAVLYEGYILYPYRRSIKNQQRWTFGGIFPRDYHQTVGGSEPCSIQTQCLIRGNDATDLTIQIRFLHLVDRKLCLPTGQFVDQVEVNGKRYQSWQEAVEQSVSIQMKLNERNRRAEFTFPAQQIDEPLDDKATIVRARAEIQGAAEIQIGPIQEDIYQVTVRVVNETSLSSQARQMSREQAQLHSMASTHVVLSSAQGSFISSIDPPPELKEIAKQCKSIGIWPVLVGEPGQTDCMLASPIILYDYPQVALESPGDLFDGAEIDEILSLRIMTLTDEEKREVADLDNQGAALLQRTEALAREQLMRLHGTMRPPRTIEAIHIGNVELRIGDHVRLNPKGGADAFDIILRGKTATLTSIEQDYENRLHLAVTIDDDPGADIGAAGKIGHRFYFRPDEVQPISSPQEAAAP